MRISPLAGPLVAFSTLLSALHFLAAHFGLYLDYWWYDIMMHLLGGAIVAGFALVVAGWVRVSGQALRPKVLFLATVAALIGVGVAWEAFEYAFDLYFTERYVLDTSMDIAMDLVGGLVAIRYAARRGIPVGWSA